jgi:hypothetical protein
MDLRKIWWKIVDWIHVAKDPMTTSYEHMKLKVFTVVNV